MGATGHLLANSLCSTCHFNELRRFQIAGQPKEDRGCWHHIVVFPNAQECARYAREPGVD